MKAKNVSDTSGDGGAAYGAGINILFTYNAAATGIAKQAQINQRSQKLWAAGALTEQDVTVHSNAAVESVNFAGNSSILNYAQNAANGAQRTATQAQQTASGAQSTANQALQVAQAAQACCDATNQRLDRMFEQSQRK